MNRVGPRGVRGKTAVVRRMASWACSPRKVPIELMLTQSSGPSPVTDHVACRRLSCDRRVLVACGWWFRWRRIKKEEGGKRFILAIVQPQKSETQKKLWKKGKEKQYKWKVKNWKIGSYIVLYEKPSLREDYHIRRIFSGQWVRQDKLFYTT